MSKMHVVQVPRPNGPLEIVEREIPQLGAGMVRIKVQACDDGIVIPREPGEMR